jgi:hypothetical protein
MPIEYETWSPIEGMPDILLDVIIQNEDRSIAVVLVPFGEDAKHIRVRFHHILAYAFYDDMAFALGDIFYGPEGVSTFIVKNYDWPGSHVLYESTGCRPLHCYRFGSQNAVVDVVASGPVTAEWISQNS